MSRAVLVALLLASCYALFAQRRPPASPPPMGREMLAAHNSVRAKLNLPPLEWSSRLAEWAADWAQTLALQHAFFHRPRNPYGENLYAVEGGLATPAKVVAAWASEASAYDYQENACLAPCGHYTQIVWRKTRQVGCGVARSTDRQIWVCNYAPPGNVIGQRPY